MTYTLMKQSRWFPIVLLLGTISTLIWLTQQPRLLQYLDPTTINAAPTKQCSLQHKNCQIERDNHHITLHVPNKIILSFEPLIFNLTFTGIIPSHVEIDFEGVEMFMGANKLTLIPTLEGNFTGTYTLPGHSDRSMTWRAKVSYLDGEKHNQVWFEFPLD